MSPDSAWAGAGVERRGRAAGSPRAGAGQAPASRAPDSAVGKGPSRRPAATTSTMDRTTTRRRIWMPCPMRSRAWSRSGVANTSPLHRDGPQLHADEGAGPYERDRPGLLVRQALSRPAYRIGRDLRHVRDDRGASDVADTQLCAGDPRDGTARSMVRINDRGPFHADRVIDLSYTAAYKLGILGEGSARAGGEHSSRGCASRARCRSRSQRAGAVAAPARRCRRRPRPPLGSTCNSARSPADNAHSFLRRMHAEIPALNGLARRDPRAAACTGSRRAPMPRATRRNRWPSASSAYFHLFFSSPNRSSSPDKPPHPPSHPDLFAYDTIMVFRDRFKHHILPDQMHILNVAFLVPDMRREFGGCAGNIAYNLRLLGGSPSSWPRSARTTSPMRERLSSSAWRRRHVRRSSRPTPRRRSSPPISTTTRSPPSIPGAMNHSHLNHVARCEDIEPGHRRARWPRRHAAARARVRRAGIPFIFDPGQGLPMFSGEELLASSSQARVRHGQRLRGAAAAGAHRSHARGASRGVSRRWSSRWAPKAPSHSPWPRTAHSGGPAARVVDPTGCGDAYRAGCCTAWPGAWTGSHRAGSLRCWARSRSQRAAARTTAVPRRDRRGQAAFRSSLRDRALVKRPRVALEARHAPDANAARLARAYRLVRLIAHLISG